MCICTLSQEQLDGEAHTSTTQRFPDYSSTFRYYVSANDWWQVIWEGLCAQEEPAEKTQRLWARNLGDNDSSCSVLRCRHAVVCFHVLSHGIGGQPHWIKYYTVCCSCAKVPLGLGRERRDPCSLPQKEPMASGRRSPQLPSLPSLPSSLGRYLIRWAGARWLEPLVRRYQFNMVSRLPGQPRGTRSYPP